MAERSSLFTARIKRPFRIVAFDWDGTAVKDRKADARAVARALEGLLRRGVQVVVITGTNFQNIDRQFCFLVDGEHKRNLYVLANRGSEAFGFEDGAAPVTLHRREASRRENELLDEVAEAVKADIERNSRAAIDIIYDRLNRRKIDLIPEWEDPPKSQIARLIKATEKRLAEAGFKGGIREAFRLAQSHACRLGLEEARITSDVKHIEVGLTDKSDSMRWIIEEMAKRKNIPPEDILVLGDEFGPVAGFEGSDFRMVLPDFPAITYVSVGKEPNGVPAGVIKVGGGPRRFLSLMREQALMHDLFSIQLDDTTCLVEEGYDCPRQREIESILAIGNGYLGTRASLQEQGRTCWPCTFVAGVFDRPDEEELEELVIFPDWLFTWIYVNGQRLALEKDEFEMHRRVTDMRRGVFFRTWRHRGPGGRLTDISFLHFASLDDPHALVSRITVTPVNYKGEITLKTGLKWYADRKPALRLLAKDPDREGGGALLVGETAYTGISAAMAFSSEPRRGFISPRRNVRSEETALYHAWSWSAEAGQEMTVDKLVSIFTSRDGGDAPGSARKHLVELERAGFDELFLRHLRAWEKRWETASMVIKGDREAQKWINFATYHLIIAGNPRDGRVSIGARALTGPVYKGHVFWDSEIFILPLFIYTHPPTARAMLEYRHHTLPGARKRARGLDCEGALYAWESTITGDDMTPTFALGRRGRLVPIVCGQLEQHISADVAFGVWNYWNATHDDRFLIEAGAEILVETARFWATRVDKEGDTYHIKYVEGPDEYHEIVDDNAYTNMMAAFNLRRAAEAVDYLRESYPEELNVITERIGLYEGEAESWLEVARGMYTGRLMGDNLIEQFAGFCTLDEFDICEYEHRDAAMDVLLGREATQRTQVVKQADVVMLLYLLEDHFSEEAIRRNFEYYEARTAHDSSLSPSIYGLVAARLGLVDAAMRYFRQAGQVDLADNMGNAAGGVHAAALGGLWQQLVMGFLGLRAGEEGMAIYPRLPRRWRKMAFTLLWRGCRLDFDVRREQTIAVDVAGKGGVKMAIYGRPAKYIKAGSTYLSEWRDGAWQDFTAVERDHERGR